VWIQGGQRVIEVDGESDDSDSQGVGLASVVRGKRFVSDPLRFTGTDLGSRTGSIRTRKSYRYQGGEDDDNISENDDNIIQDSQDSDGSSPAEKERALLESAWAQIRRAKESGNAQVDLSVAELKALEQQKKRMQMEEKKRRQAEQQRRVVVSLSDFDLPPQVVAPPPQRSSPKQTMEAPEQAGFAPTGYFPPPLAGRNRPRAATTSNRPSSRHSASYTRDRRDSSPFTFTYLQAHAEQSHRHVSDTYAAPPGARGPPMQGESWGAPPYFNHAATPPVLLIPPAARQPPTGTHDPFQYMNPGPPSPIPPPIVPARRHGSGPPGNVAAYMYSEGPVPYRGPPISNRGDSATPPVATRRRKPASDDSADATSEDDDDDGTDSESVELGEGVRISNAKSGGGGSPVSGRGRSRSEAIIVEESPDHGSRSRPATREASSQRTAKKSSPASSPAKRKPAAGGGSSRRRRGK
jgi:hypothetical protein